jgi:uncharacterized protein YjiK
MPAKSEKQRRLMAIAEHHPEKLYKKNRAVLKMSKKQLSEYASKKHHSAEDGSFLDERRRRFGV